MDLIADFSGGIGAFLSYAVPFLFVLTVIVFFHELGHFLVARWCGVRVEVFSVGFGPEIFGYTDRRGTRWKFSWVPLGGYVKFFGDEGVASTPDRDGLRELDSRSIEASFHHKPVGKRAAVVAAGPIANFILAIVIFALIFMFVGRHVTAARVDDIQAGSAAEAAGFMIGDVVKRIDGEAIESFSEMQRIVSISAGETLQIEVERDGKLVTLTAVPKEQEITDRFGNTHRVGLLGITRNFEGDVTVERYGPLTAPWMGVAIG